MSPRKGLLIGCGTVIGLMVIITLAVTGWWMLEEHSRKQDIAKAIENGKIELSQILTSWSCSPERGQDKKLNVTVWVKNNSPVRLSGRWVFRVSLDLSRLDMDCWKETFEGFSDSEMLTLGNKKEVSSKTRALLSWVRRGRKLSAGLDYEPVELNPADRKTSEVHFREYFSVESGEVEKVTHQLAIPPIEAGYKATVTFESIIP